jgi:hypothetical protein
MHLNRIAGFYFGSNIWQKEYKAMTLEEKNDEINLVFESRIEQLNAAFEQAEIELRKMRIFDVSEYQYESWGDDDVNPQFFSYGHIGMVKREGQWRLCHGYSDCQSPDINWKPIRDASIHERMAAAEHLGKLREAIVKCKEKLVPQIESAIEQIATTVEGFKRQQA